MAYLRTILLFPKAVLLPNLWRLRSNIVDSSPFFQVTVFLISFKLLHHSPLNAKGRTISTWLTDTAFFHPQNSKGRASCVPPEIHLNPLQ
jgi:hypothetical protein